MNVPVLASLRSSSSSACASGRSPTGATRSCAGARLPSVATNASTAAATARKPGGRLLIESGRRRADGQYTIRCESPGAHGPLHQTGGQEAVDTAPGVPAAPRLEVL